MRQIKGLNIILTFLLILFAFKLDAQHRWAANFGQPNHYESVHDLLEDYDKGYFLVGYHVITNISWNGWDIKTNINGEMLWNQNLIHPEGRQGKAACNDDIGNKYIAGIDFSNDNNWPFLIKFNACGEKLWCTIYQDLDYNFGFPTDIIINENGEIIVLTRFNSNDNINQVFLLCYNPNGDLLWKRPYASRTDHPLIQLPSCNKLYHFGKDYILSGYCYYPYPDDPNHFWLRPLFVGIDSLFNEKWILPFGVSDSIVGESYSVTPLNDTVIIGVGYSFAEQSGYYGRTSTMMFFNHNGEELGFNVIQRDSIAYGTLGNTLIQMEPINESLFLATAIFGTSDFFNPYGELVVDTSGKIYNVQPRPNTDGFSSLINTFDNKYVIACGINEPDMDHTDIYLYKINANLEQDTLYTQNFVYDSLCPDPIISGDIDMTNCSVVQVSIDEAPTPEEYYKSLDAITVKAYPNPADEFIRLEYKHTDRHQNIRLQCYNALGKKVHAEDIVTGQMGSKINVSSWGSGVYMAIISSEGRIVGKVKFVVK